MWASLVVVTNDTGLIEQPRGSHISKIDFPRCERWAGKAEKNEKAEFAGANERFEFSSSAA
jgi:hypothetical protein